MTALLLFQTVVEADTNAPAEKLIYGAIGAAVSTLLYWLLTRNKTTSETDRNYQQMALDVSAALAEWIEKYEKLSIRLNGILEQSSRLQQTLDERTEERNDCHELLQAARELLEKFETTLQDLIEHNHLLEDLVALKRKVQKYTQEQPEDKENTK
jgi:uncharacterized protein YecA (UPF0149 family)